MMAGRLSGRVFTPSFSTRPAKLAVSKQSRSTKRQQVSRDVARRAGTDDVGSSYANALVDLAEEQNVLNDIHDDVETLTALFKEDEDLKEFLTNPIIDAEEKKDVVSKVGEKAKFSDFFVDFLNILIDEDRLVSAEDIFSAFEDRYCELTDTQVATIYSAVKLEQEQQFLVAKKLQELTGSKNIKLKTVIDESLIAGFSVDFGSAQIDLSVKGQLEDVAQDLVAGAQGLDLGGVGKSSNGNGSEGVPQDELLGNTDVQKEVEKELSSAEGKKAAALA